MNREPIAEATDGGPTRSRSGCSHVRFRNRGRIGLLLLAIGALAWLPIDGMPGDPTPARRVRGRGNGVIPNFAFAPDGATIAAIQDYRVILWDAKGVGGAITFLGHRGPAQILAFSPDGRSLVVGGVEPDLFLCRIGEDGDGHPLGMPIRRTSGLAVSPDGRVLAASSYLDPQILLWDLAAGRERARLRGHGSPVVSLAFAPDGRILTSGGSRDRAIVLWDLAAGRPRRRLTVPPGPVYALPSRRAVAGWLRPTLPSVRSGSGTCRARVGIG
jgi:WD40 repeat protein